MSPLTSVSPSRSGSAFAISAMRVGWAVWRWYSASRLSEVADSALMRAERSREVWEIGRAHV